MITTMMHRCAVEPTLTFYPINDTLMAFRFQSFRFLANYPSVYLHCRAYSCPNTDNGAYCDQNCGAASPSSQSSARRRRDLPGHMVEYQVDSGPIVVVEFKEVARLVSASNGTSQFIVLCKTVKLEVVLWPVNSEHTSISILKTK